MCWRSNPQGSGFCRWSLWEVLVIGLDEITSLTLTVGSRERLCALCPSPSPCECTARKDAICRIVCINDRMLAEQEEGSSQKQLSASREKNHHSLKHVTWGQYRKSNSILEGSLQAKKERGICSISSSEWKWEVRVLWASKVQVGV